MNGLARLDLINEIAADLQSRLTTTEVNVFLASFGVAHKDTSMVSSKRIYVRDLLANTPILVIVEIATDLGIEIPTEMQQYQERQETGEIEATYPVEILDSLERFRADYPDPAKVAFIMMQFGQTPAHEKIVQGIKAGLAPAGITGVRADEKHYHEDLFPNVLTYIFGCGLGIAVF